MKKQQCSFAFVVKEDYNVYLASIIDQNNLIKTECSEEVNQKMMNYVQYLLQIEQHFLYSNYQSIMDFTNSLVNMTTEESQRIQMNITEAEDFIRKQLLMVLRELKMTTLFDKAMMYIPTNNFFRVRVFERILKQCGFRDILINDEFECQYPYVYNSLLFHDVGKRSEVSEMNDKYQENADNMNDFYSSIDNNDDAKGNHHETRISTLTSHTLYEASKYFESIEDFISLELAIKKCRGNLERFTYNPIPLLSETIRFFPNIKHFHVYSLYDNIFIVNGFDYTFWKQMNYNDCIKVKHKLTDKEIIYKSVVYDQSDRLIEHDEEYQKYIIQLNQSSKSTRSNVSSKSQSTSNFMHEYIIDEVVSEIGEEVFKDYQHLRSIQLPTSIKRIGKECFRKCNTLTSISLPSSIGYFDHSWFVECSNLKTIVLPDTIPYFTNGCFNQYFALKNINIPTIMTSLPNECFMNCYSLTKIEHIELIEKVGKNCFASCNSLLDIPSQLLMKENIIDTNDGTYNNQIENMN